MTDAERLKYAIVAAKAQIMQPEELEARDKALVVGTCCPECAGPKKAGAELCAICNLILSSLTPAEWWDPTH